MPNVCLEFHIKTTKTVNISDDHKTILQISEFQSFEKCAQLITEDNNLSLSNLVHNQLEKEKNYYLLNYFLLTLTKIYIKVGVCL